MITTKAVMDRLPEDAGGGPAAVLSRLRREFHACLDARADELFELADADALDEYGPRALARVWKAQYFSYWMTTMLHTLPSATDFDIQRQLGELDSITSSAAGATYLAEAYSGWPRK